MARYNEILVGRFNRFLQKFFRMKGGPPAPQRSGDIQVEVPLFSGVENRFLEGWHRFAVGALAPAVVGQNSRARFINHLTSGVVAVIERLSVAVSAADTIFVSQSTGDAALASAVGQRCLDNREPRGGNTLGASCQTTVGANQVITGGVVARLITNGNIDIPVIQTDDQEITVLPNAHL